mmetsp:Transcript_28260/g.46936  ORF Transcript_28260/g.46936 Transcript_28260/m.46936 type:complete len:130 (-) Transcript_28260:353-742(-)
MKNTTKESRAIPSGGSLGGYPPSRHSLFHIGLSRYNRQTSMPIWNFYMRLLLLRCARQLTIMCTTSCIFGWYKWSTSCIFRKASSLVLICSCAARDCNLVPLSTHPLQQLRHTLSRKLTTNKKFKEYEH